MIVSFRRRASSKPAASVSDRLIASPLVSRAAQHGQTMLLDLGSGDYYSLNETGAFIWEMVRRGTTLGEIVDALEAQYDAPRDVITGDVAAITTEWIEASMVVIERAR
jgi:Coenzyme PQQ synthesis protein D (PqqD)